MGLLKNELWLAKTGRSAPGRSTYLNVGDARYVTFFLDAKGAASGSAKVKIKTSYQAATGTGQTAPNSFDIGSAFTTITTVAVKELKTFSVYANNHAAGMGAVLWVDFSIDTAGAAQTFGVGVVLRD